MRPAVLQYLKHGKALCGKVFAGFVETYNHLVSFSANLKGDADLPGAKEGIHVDRTDPDHPVIRLVKQNANAGGDGNVGGKTIVSVEITPSAASGGKNTMVFTYSDGSTDTFEVMNGLDGKDGSGGDGEVPDINVDTQGDHTYIYIDGDLVATIPHGKTPAITANKDGKITTISCDGNPIATICDGADGSDAPGGETPTDQGQEATFITDISFSLSGGKLVANLTKKRGKVVGLTDVDVSTVDVATSKEVTVVTGESYSQTTHQFTNTRTKITVLDESSAQGETVFTSTPLSAE